MDSSNEPLLKLEAMEREEPMLHESIDTYIGEISQEFSRNDSWETFKPDEIAEALLSVVDNRNDCSIHDEEAHRFRQFLSLATNFASLTYVQRLQRIPDLVETIKQLVENMIKEVQEYRDIASDLRDFIQDFVRLVVQAKHNVNMMLPLLTAAKSQMTIVQDVMSTDITQALNEIDKKDLQLALNRMASGIQNLLTLAETSKAESRKLGERIDHMTTSVQSKKITVERRLKFGSYFRKGSTLVGAIAPPVVVGGCITAPVLGGAGALVIGGMAFPPLAAIFAALVLGGICAGTIMVLMKKLWARQQRKALKYLEKILECLFELSSANVHFMTYMTDIKEKANEVSQHTDDIKQYLESERFRQANRDVCTVAITSTTAMIESLKQISSLDISNWTRTSDMISFSRTINIPIAIENS